MSRSPIQPKLLRAQISVGIFTIRNKNGQSDQLQCSFLHCLSAFFSPEVVRLVPRNHAKKKKKKGEQEKILYNLLKGYSSPCFAFKCVLLCSYLIRTWIKMASVLTSNSIDLLSEIFFFPLRASTEMEISPPAFCLAVSKLLWLLFNFEGEKKKPQETCLWTLSKMRTVGSGRCLLYCIALQVNNTWYKTRGLLNLHTLFINAFRMLWASFAIILHLVSLRTNGVTGLPPLQSKQFTWPRQVVFFILYFVNKLDEIHARLPTCICFSLLSHWPVTGEVWRSSLLPPAQLLRMVN